jgi:hypothetical protein
MTLQEQNEKLTQENIQFREMLERARNKLQTFLESEGTNAPDGLQALEQRISALLEQSV